MTTYTPNFSHRTFRSATDASRVPCAISIAPTANSASV